MQPSTCLSVILACIAATAAIPLELEADDGSALRRPLKKATADVNKQIPKMQQSLKDAENRDAKALRRLELAFGPQGLDQIKEIRDNIAKIDAGKMIVSHEAPKDVDKKRLGKISAYTPFYYRASANDHLKTDPVEFGTLFDDRPPKGKKNAATVLHEAAHVFAHASDDHYTTGTMDMVPLGLHPDAHTSEVRMQGGYAAVDPVVGSAKNPITDDHLDSNFKAVRDSATNMHMNADSYALFGAACDAEMARRRKRALIEDDPVSYYLAKRGAASCKLPPDHFKKKAAAKAAKEKAASTSSPASKFGIVKTASKNAARVRLGGQKTIKGGNPLAASKGTPKTLRKASKSMLPNTSKSSLSKGLLKGSKAKVPTTKMSKASSRTKLSNSKTSKLPSKAPKGAFKGSKSKVPTSRTSKASTRGKLSKARSSKLSSKTPASSRAKGSKEKSSKAVFKGTRTKLSSKMSSKVISKMTGRPASSKMKASKPLSKTSEAKISKARTLRPSSKASIAKTPESLSKSSKSKLVKSVKANTKASTPTQKASTTPKKAVKGLSKPSVAPVQSPSSHPSALKAAAPLKKKNGRP